MNKTGREQKLTRQGYFGACVSLSELRELQQPFAATFRHLSQFLATRPRAAQEASVSGRQISWVDSVIDDEAHPQPIFAEDFILNTVKAGRLKSWVDDVRSGKRIKKRFLLSCLRGLSPREAMRI